MKVRKCGSKNLLSMVVEGVGYSLVFKEREREISFHDPATLVCGRIRASFPSSLIHTQPDDTKNSSQRPRRAEGEEWIQSLRRGRFDVLVGLDLGWGNLLIPTYFEEVRELFSCVSEFSLAYTHIHTPGNSKQERVDFLP